VIDPSVPFDRFGISGVRVDFVLLTHGHFDHILCLEDYVSRFNCKVYISFEDRHMLVDPYSNASALFGLPPISVSSDVVCLSDGDVISFNDDYISVVSTPGHTAGSVCYRINDMLFSGDTLFRDGIGRCDLPSGDYLSMGTSLKKLRSINEELKIYPGHGNETTLSREKKFNLEMLST